MRVIRTFFSLVDAQMILVILLCVGATFACLHFGFSANLPSGLIGVTIIFPVVFSINAAYRRREAGY